MSRTIRAWRQARARGIVDAYPFAGEGLVVCALVLLVLLTLLAIAPISPGLSKDDEAAWGQATSRHTAESYWEYLEQFPSGPHAEEAFRRMIDMALGQEVGGHTEDLLEYSMYLYDRAEAILSRPRDQTLSVSRDYLLKAMLILELEHTRPDAMRGSPGKVGVGDPLLKEDIPITPLENKEAADLIKEARELLESLIEADLRTGRETATVPGRSRSQFVTSSFQCLTDRQACGEQYGWLDCELIMLVCVLESIVPSD